MSPAPAEGPASRSVLTPLATRTRPHTAPLMSLKVLGPRSNWWVDCGQPGATARDRFQFPGDPDRALGSKSGIPSASGGAAKRRGTAPPLPRHRRRPGRIPGRRFMPVCLCPTDERVASERALRRRVSAQKASVIGQLLRQSWRRMSSGTRSRIPGGGDHSGLTDSGSFCVVLKA